MPINTPKIKIKIDTIDSKYVSETETASDFIDAFMFAMLQPPVKETKVGHPKEIKAEKIKTINDVKWNLIIKTEKALEKELDSNHVISPERVTALTGLMDLLIKKY